MALRLQWIWLDAGCLALMGGVLAKAFLRDLNRYPAYPLKKILHWPRPWGSIQK